MTTLAGDPVAIAGFPHLETGKDEIVMHHAQRNGYDYAIRQTGARLVEIGTLDGTTVEDLETALTIRTGSRLTESSRECQMVMLAQILHHP